MGCVWVYLCTFGGDARKQTARRGPTPVDAYMRGGEPARSTATENRRHYEDKEQRAHQGKSRTHGGSVCVQGWKALKILLSSYFCVLGSEGWMDQRGQGDEKRAVSVQCLCRTTPPCASNIPAQHRQERQKLDSFLAPKDSDEQFRETDRFFGICMSGVPFLREELHLLIRTLNYIHRAANKGAEEISIGRQEYPRAESVFYAASSFKASGRGKRRFALRVAYLRARLRDVNRDATGARQIPEWEVSIHQTCALPRAGAGEGRARRTQRQCRVGGSRREYPTMVKEMPLSHKLRFKSGQYPLHPLEGARAGGGESGWRVALERVAGKGLKAARSHGGDLGSQRRGAVEGWYWIDGLLGIECGLEEGGVYVQYSSRKWQRW
ncbi:hypothetical protein C8J57DRAFT_1468725 [Mycena rebaudengoi]|nr:hypothetical protein C8J57DRAFT_1468725 [Mycena rebaudengoi]